jgi:hypothetical protein
MQMQRALAAIPRHAKIDALRGGLQRGVRTGRVSVAGCVTTTVRVRWARECGMLLAVIQFLYQEWGGGCKEMPENASDGRWLQMSTCGVLVPRSK